TFTHGVLRPADSNHSPALGTHVDRWCAGLSLLRPAEALPVSRLVLSSLLHRVRRTQGKELLSWANLSGLPGGRSGGDRELHRTVASSLAEARARGASSRRRSLACPRGHARAPRCSIHFLHGSPTFQSASQRAQPHS